MRRGLYRYVRGRRRDVSRDEAARALGGGRGERERRPIATVVDVLDAWGYEPTEPRGRIVLGNCPFDALAKACRPLVCKMNLALLRGVLKGVGARNLKAELRPQP